MIVGYYSSPAPPSDSESGSQAMKRRIPKPGANAAPPQEYKWALGILTLVGKQIHINVIIFTYIMICVGASPNRVANKKYMYIYIYTHYISTCGLFIDFKPPSLQAGNHLSWKGTILWNLQNNMVWVVPDTLGIGQEETIQEILAHRLLSMGTPIGSRYLL